MSGKYTYLKLTCLLLGLVHYTCGQAPIGNTDPCFDAGQLPRTDPDFSDNLSCPRIDGVLQCYAQSELCDGNTLCVGGSDEGDDLVALDCDGSLSGRGIPTFVCTPGENIDIDLLCDGNDDCANGDDETSTLCENKCLLPYYGGCPPTRECLTSEFDVNCGSCLTGFVDDPANPGGACLPLIFITLTQSAYTTSEDDPSVQICAEVTNPASIAAGEVFIATLQATPQTATTPADFTDITPVDFQFTSTQVMDCINIPIIDDTIEESTEIFQVSLTSTNTRVRITPTSVANVFIEDNEPTLVGFQFSSYTFPEQDSPPGQVCLVTRNSIPLQSTVNVAISSTNGMAIAGLDFQPISTQVTFGPGVTIDCFDVNIIGDQLAEGEECFLVNAQTTNSAELLIAQGEETATVCIEDDDLISFDLQTQDVGEAAGVAQACVELTSPSLLRDVEVDIQTMAIGSATAGGVDYTDVTMTFTFNSGAVMGAEMCINIPINNDLLVENTESFQVEVASDPNVTFDPVSGTAIINIIDNDVAIFQFTQFEYEEFETNSPLDAGLQLVSGTLTFPITILVQSMAFTGTGDAATVGQDYAAFSQSFMFSSGSLPGAVADIDVTLFDDALVESDETFVLSATILNNIPTTQADFTQLRDQANGIIRSEDVLSVGFEMSIYTTSEGVPFQEVCLVTRNTAQLPAGTQATVSVSTSNGAALAGLDYNALFESVTFSLGVNRDCVNIGIIDDSDPENQECFFANAGTNDADLVVIVPGQQQTEICINDNDLINFDVQLSDAMEGDGNTLACLQLESSVLPREVEIDFATTGLGSAIAGVDYTSVASTLIFPSGTTSTSPNARMCVSIPITDDILCEMTESFQVSFATDSDVFLDGQPGGAFNGFVNIMDNDNGVVSWTLPSYSELEDNSPLTATLQLTGCTLTSPALITVNTGNTNPVSAQAGADYTPLINQVITFASGSMSGSQMDVDVILVNDLFAEQTESFNILAETSTPGISIGVISQTTGNIVDDDVCEVAFEMGQYDVVEGPGDMTQDVCLIKRNTVILQEEVVVNVATADGEKTAGLDYVAFSGTVTFGPGVTRQCVTLQLLDDDLDEPEECLRVIANSQSSSLDIINVSGTNSEEALVCCIDDDANMFGFEFPSIDVPEQGPQGECCVILEEGTLTRLLSITVSTQDGTAIGGQDFTPGPFVPTLNFPSGSGPGTRRCLQTSVINDNQVEGPESYTLTLSATDPSVVFIAGRDTKTVNIIEDPNDVVNICLQLPTSDTVLENAGPHQECVEITGLPDRLEKSVSLMLSTSNGLNFETDAQASVDYTGLINQVITFTPTNQNDPMCVPIQINNDLICENDETFSVNLMSNDPCVSINSAICTGTVTIQDDDVATVRSTQPTYSVNEGETLEIDIQLFGQKGPGRECVVSVSTMDGTALSTVMWRDYFALPPTMLTFDSSNTVESIFINVCDDSKCEGDEEFEVILSTSSDGCTVDNTPIPVTIIDDEVDTHGLGDDPHFSIALPSGELLCYTVQGEHGFSFNLISNHKMAMNAKFVPDARRPEVTWLGSIGIIVQNTNYKGSNETKLRFDVDTKSIYIGDKVELEARNIEKLTFTNGKLTISEAPPKEGFHYPSVYVDLEDVQLQFTVKYTNQHLDIYWHSTGGRLSDSHGLIGQFFRKGVEIDEVRKILIMPNKEPIPVMRRPVWSFMEREMSDEQLCWTAMNPGYQGEGLIDGTYFDYLVDDVLSTDFKFEK